jgi:ubiquinone biosynthesis protein Coq4
MTNPLRIARAVKSAVRLVTNPSRLDQVFELADATVTPAILAQVAAAIGKDPKGARALEERPRLSIVLFDLRRLARGTLGREYAEHMIANRLDPAALPALKARDRLSYIRAHLYETHDVWHVVTGFGTDVAGELGLQAFYIAQLPARLSIALVAGGLLNALFFHFDERDARMDAIAHGWLLGKRAKPLFGARWDELWTAPLDEVRRMFDVAVEPERVAA